MKCLRPDHADENAVRSLPREEASRMRTADIADTGAVRKAGPLLGPHRVGPAEATPVRAPGGRHRVVDGPFAETKEQLG